MDTTMIMLTAFAAVVGAALGSFLNVCIIRLPAERSVVAPPSSCPGCGARIRWFDNIPIFSYVILRGKCRNCHARISPQYPIVEAITALCWATAVWRFGFSLEALHSAVFLTLILGMAMTDLREMVIPDQFSLGGVVLGLALAAVPGGFPFLQHLAGAALAFALLWAVKLAAEKALKKPALGVGDIHMMAMVGAFLGPGGALLTILLGSVLGLVIGVPVSWLRGNLEALSTYLPLGVFLALGAAVAHLWGAPLMAWYLGYVMGM